MHRLELQVSANMPPATIHTWVAAKASPWNTDAPSSSTLSPLPGEKRPGPDQQIKKSSLPFMNQCFSSHGWHIWTLKSQTLRLCLSKFELFPSTPSTSTLDCIATFCFLKPLAHIVLESSTAQFNLSFFRFLLPGAPCSNVFHSPPAHGGDAADPARGANSSNTQWPSPGLCMYAAPGQGGVV